MDHLKELQKILQPSVWYVIHFNSATVQFHSGELMDWEYDPENNGAPRLYPFNEKNWNPTELDCAQWAALPKVPAPFRGPHHQAS